MKYRQLVSALLAAVVANLGLLGCHHNRETVYVQQEPAYVVVQEPPPAIIVEQRPLPPSPDCVWVEGYWHWGGHRYNWQHGHWVVPPQPRTVWVAPRYERFERGYHYRPGYWHGEGREDGRRRDRH